MSRRVHELAAALEKWLGRSPRIAILSDFDGTLAELVPRPEDAVLLPEAKAALTALTARTGAMVAIVSGRALEDLRSRVDVPDLLLAGNHGLEIEGRSLYYRHPGAVSLQPQLRDFCNLLRKELRGYDGAEVEEKGLTATVHFRRVSPERREEAAAAVFHAAERSMAPVCVRCGLLSLEIRPAVEWDKGAAARWILAHTGVPLEAAVCLGDDLTDEDLFRALPKAFSVKVGLEGESAAPWRLSGPAEVAAWLGRLADLAGAYTDTKGDIG